MRPDGKYEFTVEVIDQGKHFRLAPVMFDAGQQGVMRTPDIASFITRDIYVSPVAVEEPEVAGTAHERYTVPKGDSIAIGDARARFVRFDMGGHGGGMAGGGSMEIGSVLEITSRDARETVTPAAIYRGNAGPEYRPAPSRILNASVQLVGLNVGMGGGARSTVTFEVQPVNDASHPMEILVVEASVKPYISLVWGGTLVMMGGFLLSILKRSQEA
jgi:cytochrome c-type biogenesis protein CcmF